MVNANKLLIELTDVDLPAVCVDEYGTVIYSRVLSAEEQVIADDVIANHDPVAYEISPSEIIIAADGIDKAVFTIKASPSAASVNILVAGNVIIADLTNGVGTVAVTSDMPGVIVVVGESGGLADCIAKVFAGEVV